MCTSPVSPALPEFISPDFHIRLETREGSLEHNLQTSQARKHKYKGPSVINPPVSRMSNTHLLQSQDHGLDVIPNHEQARCTNYTSSFSPLDSSSLLNQTTDQWSPAGETADFELEELEQSANTIKQGRIRLGKWQNHILCS